MKTYKVKSNLKHNGTLYTKGQEVELDEAVATQLLSDNVIKELNSDVEDEDAETPQPPVNKVTREGDNTDGKAKVEPGKVEKPQPGDENDKDNQDLKMLKYKILKNFEYNKVDYKVDEIIELAEENVSKFGEELIELVKDEEDKL